MATTRDLREEACSTKSSSSKIWRSSDFMDVLRASAFAAVMESLEYSKTSSERKRRMVTLFSHSTSLVLQDGPGWHRAAHGEVEWGKGEAGQHAVRVELGQDSRIVSSQAAACSLK